MSAAEFRASPEYESLPGTEILSMNRTNSACALLRKRRRAAALHDAVALAKVSRTSARFWSAPPLRRFGFSREVHGPNACERGLSMNRPFSVQTFVAYATKVCRTDS